MNDAIIVLNAGSSSLKFSIYAIADETRLELEARGQIEGLGTAPRFKAKDRQGRLLNELNLKPTGGTFDHPEAFAYLANWMRQQFGGQLSPVAIGHRMAHGGLNYTHPTLITNDVLAELERLIPLVPLHQPHNLAAVRGVIRLRPDLPQVACFDTAFHRGRAMVTERFGLPDDLFQTGLRRWGFHGLSYESISTQFRQIAPDLASGRLIVAHLGSGASLCAIRDGRSVDTTMSFSALDGLPMGTRCGALDPGAVLFLLQTMTRQEVENLLYKKSGLLGISGISNDVRELLASNAPRAIEAVDFFVYRVIREIGSLTAALGGIDALIFTAGIGENSSVIRHRIVQGLTWLGLALDPTANDRNQPRISPSGSTPSVWVIPTDEESVIATHTLEVVASISQHKGI